MLNNMVNMYDQAYTKINSIISSTGTQISTNASNDLAGGQSGAQGTANNVANGAVGADGTTNFNTNKTQTLTPDNQAFVDKFQNNPNSNMDDGLVHVTAISLNKSSLFIEKGGKITLVATLTPSNASNMGVGYVSDNVNVATVSANGVVTGVGKGKATITATAADQNKRNLSATCVVNVVTRRAWTLEPKLGQKNNGTSDLNKYLARKGYGQVSAEQAAAIASEIGILGVTKNNIFNATHSKDRQQAMIAQLQKIGYSTGGTITKNGYLPDNLLGKINDGEDGWIRVQEQETILTKRGGAILNNDIIPQALAYKDLMTKIPDYVGQGNQSTIVNETHFDSLLTVNGDIDKEVFPGVKKMCEEAYKYVDKKNAKDLKRLGYK